MSVITEGVVTVGVFTVGVISGSAVIPPIDPPVEGDNTVQFTNPNSAAGTWHFGDGNSSSSIDPTHEYAVHGTYEAVFISDSGNDDTSLTVIVTELPLPVASFTATERDPRSDIYDFVGSGAGVGGAYSWLINGDPYFTQNVTHTFLAAGDYLAELVVTDAANNTDYSSELLEGVLLPNNPPVGAFTYNAFKLDVAFTSNVTDPDGDAMTYSWDMGDGIGTSTDVNPDYLYLTDGTYTVIMTVTDTRGGVLVYQEDVTVSSTLNLGPELMANPDFVTADLSDFVSSGATTDVTGGVLTITGGGSSRLEIKSDGNNDIGLDDSKLYVMTLTSKQGTGASPRAYNWTGTTDGAGGFVDTYLRDADWTTREVQFSVNTGDEGIYVLRFYPDAGSATVETLFISQLSIKELL